MGRRGLTALASAMILMVMSASAFSGSSTYDMQPLLNAQHPFAQDPTGLPTGAVQPHNAAPIGAQYSTYNPLSEIAPSAGQPPEPKADDTLVELVVWGDEFYVRYETPDGYTAVKDPESAALDEVVTSFRNAAVVSANAAE